MLFFFNEQEAADSFSLNFKIKKSHITTRHQHLFGRISQKLQSDVNITDAVLVSGTLLSICCEKLVTHIVKYTVQPEPNWYSATHNIYVETAPHNIFCDSYVRCDSSNNLIIEMTTRRLNYDPQCTRITMINKQWPSPLSPSHQLPIQKRKVFRP